MTLAELRSFNAAAEWRRLSPVRQCQIGQAALLMMVSQLVAADDGSETTPDDRHAARGLAEQHQDQLETAVEQAMPGITWWEPVEFTLPELVAAE